MPESILGLDVPLLVQGWRRSSTRLSARCWCLGDVTRGKEMDGKEFAKG